MLRKDQLKPLGTLASTADAAEVARFDSLAAEWHKPDGAFKVVHQFNAARIAHLATILPRHFGRDPSGVRPLAGLRLIDVGCGAGLVAEPMARLGADVVGIDASERNVAVASRHAALSGLSIAYRHALPEVLAAEPQRFDVVLTLEVVEHVADIHGFLAACAGLLAPGGILVVATLNRTAKSFALAIVGAEYVLGWLPRGTHDWNKFVLPSELDAGFARHGLRQASLDGVVMNPLTRRWSVARDSSVNYIATYAGPGAVAGAA
jgi:2-polyprenyl-6-hydroxyphenyl methylase/3-demethylubiquinone-9 3-methyltransferase